MCLAQGRNVVRPVRLKPATLGYRVKHSTTEPLRSHIVATNVQLGCKEKVKSSCFHTFIDTPSCFSNNVTQDIT